MHLKADAVQRYAARHKIVHHVVHGLELGTGCFSVVVVIKEQRVRIGGVRPPQRLLDEACTW